MRPRRRLSAVSSAYGAVAASGHVRPAARRLRRRPCGQAAPRATARARRRRAPAPRGQDVRRDDLLTRDRAGAALAAASLLARAWPGRPTARGRLTRVAPTASSPHSSPMPGSVRVGDTVRRPARPWTPSVHALLAHLHAHGLAGVVPAPLAGDDRGEEVVGHLPGEVPAYPMPDWVWEAPRLDEAARLLRRVHDATASGFDVRGRRWQLPVREPAEVVCHNDFAPYNLVFAAGDHRLTGVIDFEAASPGPRAWDLAYLAYRLVPLAGPQNPDLPALDAAVRDERLARLVAAYGAPMTAAEVMRLVAPRLDALAATAPEPAHRALYAADAAHVRAQARRLQLHAALDRNATAAIRTATQPMASPA